MMKRFVLPALVTTWFVLFLAIGYEAQTAETRNNTGMTQELMARLVKYSRGTPDVFAMDGPVCKILDLCDGTQRMAIMICESDVGGHFFGVPKDENLKDIVIFVRGGPNVATFYLTDKTGVLRAAAVSDSTGIRLITNAKAADGFNAEMKQFAIEAAVLPPTKP